MILIHETLIFLFLPSTLHNFPLHFILFCVSKCMLVTSMFYLSLWGMKKKRKLPYLLSLFFSILIFFSFFIFLLSWELYMHLHTDIYIYIYILMLTLPIQTRSSNSSMTLHSPLYPPTQPHKHKHTRGTRQNKVHQ